MGLDPVVSVPDAAPGAPAGLRIAGPADWGDVMEALGVGDVYFGRAHHEVAAELEPGARPLLLHLAARGGGVALPLLVRPLPGGEPGFDAATAYGYGGVVAAGHRPPLDRFGGALRAWARESGVVTTFLRCHPTLGTWRWTPPEAELVPLAATVAWRLEPGRDLEGGLHAHHRRAVRAARRAGVEVAVEEGVGDLARLRELYLRAMERRGAGAFYRFPDAYWARLAERLGAEAVTAVARLDGSAEAALLCIGRPPTLHYHLSGSSERARASHATHLCLLAVAEWAQERGYRWLHLGGGVGSRPDALFTFKRRFDPAAPLRPFHVAKIVHDRRRYRELAGGDDTSGFFPPWRAPAAS